MATLKENYQADLQALYQKLGRRGDNKITQADFMELLFIVGAILSNFDRLVKNE